MTKPWSTVLSGLTGLRLRVWDDLTLRGELSTGTLAQLPAPRGIETLEAVLIWLQEHRFVRGTGAAWRAVPVRQAQELWERHGPDRVAVAVSVPPVVPPPAPPTPIRPPEPPARPSHSHQVEFFALDGYST